MFIIESESIRTQPAQAVVLALFFKDQLLTINHDTAHLPSGDDAVLKTLLPEKLYYAGTCGGKTCYAGVIQDCGTEGFVLTPLRKLFGTLDAAEYRCAATGLHVLHWARTHRFCGCCGAETAIKPDERALACPDCTHVFYPRISPAIIVAVVREKKILLAHSAHFTPGLYTVIAGFVEPGETLEDCVSRELMEEVGITVKNIRYFASQPWPFPDSLMTAFTAEYDAGEITVDNHEIIDAGWYSADSIPLIPEKVSVARRLIDCFVATHG